MQLRMSASRVERRLAELIACDTRNPGGDERALATQLAAALGGLGAEHVAVLPAAGHFSAFARFGSKPPALLINAHLDTVPINAGYTTEPFRLERRGRRLFGLGSADTKGAIAAVLEALALRREAGEPLAGVAVLFSGDEELGGASMRDFLASGRGAGLHRALVCEPTGCQVGIRHRGVYAARVSASSPGGHSSLADRLPNPLSALARAAVALDDLGGRHRDTGPEGLRGLCMNVAALDGGKAFNIIPAAAALTFSLRPPPGVALAPILDEVRGAVATATAPLATDWEPVASNPAFATREPASFGDLFGERGFVDLPFGTEAGQLVEAGIDAVVIGPGRIEQAHAPDEYVELDDLEAAVTLFDQILARAAWEA
jgi:acetylornithine deacetylase/succinyl-diaminopimelate desuccinylase-like protein